MAATMPSMYQITYYVPVEKTLKINSIPTETRDNAHARCNYSDKSQSKDRDNVHSCCNYGGEPQTPDNLGKNYMHDTLDCTYRQQSRNLPEQNHAFRNEVRQSAHYKHCERSLRNPPKINNDEECSSVCNEARLYHQQKEFTRSTQKVYNTHTYECCNEYLPQRSNASNDAYYRQILDQALHEERKRSCSIHQTEKCYSGTSVQYIQQEPQDLSYTGGENKQNTNNLLSSRTQAQKHTVSSLHHISEGPPALISLEDINVSREMDSLKSDPKLGIHLKQNNLSHSNSQESNDSPKHATYPFVNISNDSTMQSHNCGYTGSTQTGKKVKDVFILNDVGNVQIGENNVMTIHPHTSPMPVTSHKDGGYISKIKTSHSRPKSAVITGPKLKKMVITSSKKQLDVTNMEMLTKHLGLHWKELARCLGFSDGEIDAIDHDNIMLKEKIWQLLRYWKESRAEKATLCAVADALIAMRKYDIAVMLKAR